jgi:hypothetical protein
VSAEATADTKPEAGIDLGAHTELPTEAATEAGTRAEFAYAGPETVPTGTTTGPESTGSAVGAEPGPPITPSGAMTVPPMVAAPTGSRLTPAWAEAAPAGSESVAELSGAWSEAAPSGLQAEPAVPAAVQARVNRTKQSAAEVARDRTAEAQGGAGAVDNRGHRVTD